MIEELSKEELAAEIENLRESLGEARDLLRSACSDLNSAHDQICRLQDLDPPECDWPEWSSPAHTIRHVERMLGERLAKTDQWTEYPDRERGDD